MKNEILVKIKNYLDEENFGFPFNEIIYHSFSEAAEEISREIEIEDQEIVEEILSDFCDELTKEETEIYDYRISKLQVLYINDDLEGAFEDYLNEIAA